MVYRGYRVGSGDEVPSLGRKGPLEKEMAAHSSVLAWEIPWTEEPGWLQSTGSQRLGHDERTRRATKQQQQEGVKVFCVSLFK